MRRELVISELREGTWRELRWRPVAAGEFSIGKDFFFSFRFLFSVLIPFELFFLVFLKTRKHGGLGGLDFFSLFLDFQDSSSWSSLSWFCFSSVVVVFFF